MKSKAETISQLINLSTILKIVHNFSGKNANKFAPFVCLIRNGICLSFEVFIEEKSNFEVLLRIKYWVNVCKSLQGLLIVLE